MTDFIAASHFTQGRISSVDLLVLHTAEGPTDAHDLGRYFRDTDRDASSHSGADASCLVNYVHFTDTAYAAPGANADGDHLELCGFASWSHAEWMAHDGLLDQAAKWLAQRAHARAIPLVFRDAAELKADKRGVTFHREVSEAFHLSTHTDPGLHFPIDHVLELARTKLAHLDDHDRPAATRTAPRFPGQLGLGSHGTAVAAWQRRLARRWGYLVKVDGSFGARTQRATRGFQHDHRLEVDGIVGPKTWAAAWPS